MEALPKAGHHRVIYPLMPKGVEHANRWTDDVSPNRVIYPLMPKGVEHPSTSWGSLSQAFLVIYPLMPKGVEHTFSGTSLTVFVLVIYPLMPKGVEHMKRKFKKVIVHPL